MFRSLLVEDIILALLAISRLAGQAIFVNVSTYMNVGIVNTFCSSKINQSINVGPTQHLRVPFCRIENSSTPCS